MKVQEHNRLQVGQTISLSIFRQARLCSLFTRTVLLLLLGFFRYLSVNFHVLVIIKIKPVLGWIKHFFSETYTFILVSFFHLFYLSNHVYTSFLVCPGTTFFPTGTLTANFISRSTHPLYFCIPSHFYLDRVSS
jgi:hypothetical protein